MPLDVPTMMAMGSLVSACAAIALFVAWWLNNKISALGLWALGDAAAAGGILSLILAVVSRQPHLSILGGGLMVLAPGLMWKAAREFDGKPGSVVVALLGVAVFGLANAIPFTRNITGSLFLAISAVYYLATTATLWIGRADKLAARLPIVVLVTAHAAVLSIGACSTLIGVVSQNAVPSVMSLFGVVHFENNIFTIGAAVSILSLVKERNEALSARAARTDGLTGIANRSAFFESAEGVIERCRHECAPVSVMMFDVDLFKTVNDTHGHAVGDDVLRNFGKVLAKALRSNDVFGRIGGEEFAVVLPGADIEAACVRAERIRASFAENCRFVADRQIDPTVSCGVSVSANAEQSLSVLLKQADIALYRAKAAGRNRVERANQPEAKTGSPTERRVA